ncbi:MAG: ABC transporter permease [Gemmatimonadota bacterium]
MIVRIVGWILALLPEAERSQIRDEALSVVRQRATEPRAGPRRAMFAGGEMWGALRLVAGAHIDRWNGTTTRGEARMIETTRQDVRFAWRTLRRNPGFALSAIGVLALGIGANAAIFTAANAFFFSPLPFEDSGRLVTVFETNPDFGWEDATAAPANLLDWREEVGAFADVSGYSEFTSQITTFQADGPVVVGGSMVLGNFFDVLGVAPVMGRGFTMDETWQGNGDVVVISHALWLDYFGADPDVVGKTIEFNGGPQEVVGVMPQGFHFPTADTQLWFTNRWDPAARTQVWFRRAHIVRAFARLEPEVSHETAQAQLEVVMDRLEEAYPGTNTRMGAGIMPMRDFLVRGVRTQILVLLGAVGLLLVLACANVANLMLVRANDRTREIALRRAIGAGRGRIVRQLLVESALIAGVGSVLGLVLGSAGVRLLTASQPLGIEGATALALDGRVLAFTAAIGLSAGLFFGIVPAIRLTSDDVDPTLRDGGRGNSGGRGGLRTVRALVATEIALALVLTLGAGLMIRTFAEMRSVDPGFSPEGLVAVQFTVPSTRYQNRDEVLAFYNEMIESLEARPGIVSAGTVGQLPLAGTSWSSQLKADTWGPDRVGYEVLHRRADADYFETVETPLLRGRLFDGRDGPEDPLVIVINEAAAEQYFPGEDPVGQRVAYDREPTPESNWYEIIGIVGNQHQESPKVEPRAEVFENRDQDWGRSSWVVVRGGGEVDGLVPQIREVLGEMDSMIPIARTRVLRDVWRTSMAREEFLLQLLSVFGAVALALASVGVYGVTAQAARRRTQEIGIRMALGAAKEDVVRMMIRQGAAVVAVGLVVGVALTMLTTTALASVLDPMLFGVRPTDPATLVTVVALLSGLAVLASYLPARRAAVVDPVSSLRAE